jgi:hypothetical protein
MIEMQGRVKRKAILHSKLIEKFLQVRHSDVIMFGFGLAANVCESGARISQFVQIDMARVLEIVHPIGSR